MPHGRNTYAPWLIGGIYARLDGSEIDITMTIHPVVVAAMIAFLCVPQYFAIRAGGFSVGFLAGFLVFHLLMYYFAFVPDALDAESLIREVAAMSERESRTTA